MTSAARTEDVLLEAVAVDAEASGRFAGVALRGGMLICRARASGAPASYRLSWDGPVLWVSLVTADRWLSESIEADLMHTGDRIEELIEEELVEQGVHPGPITCEHFRSDDLLFTFRSRVELPPSGAGSPEAARVAGAWLRAYEGAFRELGDMSVGASD